MQSYNLNPIKLKNIKDYLERGIWGLEPLGFWNALSLLGSDD